MARYGTQIQQQPIDMYNSINTEFYNNLLGKAQQDLTQSAGMQAKFLEDAYGQKYLDRATRDVEVGKAEQAVAGALDKDFVSPAQTIKTISKASQGLTPWRNLNERQMELAKQAEAFKLQHGANAWMTDPSKISLTNEDGSLKTPEQLKFEGINVEDIDKRFIGINKEYLDKPYYEAPTRKGAPAGNLRFVEGKGLLPNEIADLYDPITGKMSNQVAEQILADTPQLIEIKGSREAALEAIKNRNYATAGSYGYTRNTQFMKDGEYLDPLQRAQLDKLNAVEDTKLPSKTTNIVANNVDALKVSDKLQFKNGKLDTTPISPIAVSGSTSVGIGIPTTSNPSGISREANELRNKRESGISQLTDIRKNTGYDQLKPNAMTYTQFTDMATKNGLSTSENAYRNWLEKTNSYVVSSQKLAESYDNALTGYSKTAGKYKVVSGISGNSYMDMIGADLDNTRAYVAGMDTKGQTPTWKTVADNLNISMTELDEQLKGKDLRVAGITGRTVEPGMFVFNLKDNKGNSHTVYGSSNDDIAEGMKLSNALHKNILAGKSGIVTDETGQAITNASPDGTRLYTYETDSQLDVSGKGEFNPVIVRTLNIWDEVSKRYVPTNERKSVTLDEVEDLEIAALKKSNLLGTNLDQVTKEKPN